MELWGSIDRPSAGGSLRRQLTGPDFLPTISLHMSGGLVLLCLHVVTEWRRLILEPSPDLVWGGLYI